MHRSLPSASSFVAAGLATALFALPGMSLTASLLSSSPPAPRAQAETWSGVEIDEALSAAPRSFASTADVYLVSDGELTKVRDGGGRTACVLTRTHPESSFPMCYDAASTHSVLPITILRTRLYAQGLDGPEIHARITAAIDSGELPTPVRGSMVWMISPHQVIYAAGQRVGQWFPHVMVYMPGVTLADLGLTEPQRGDTILVNGGTAVAHLLIKTRSWSDADAWKDR